jgi:hypothetical protein
VSSSGSPDARHQVFVSSTYTDLVEERRAIIQALLELDCFPAGMEMFPAANEDQWTLIREVIDLSDYYVVVVGGRYGSVSAEGISYTEMEYDYAISRDIPVLGFVHADPGSIPASMTELDPDAREKLDAFRDKVMTRMVKQYRTPDDLASVVSRGLIRAIKKQPRPGWVRGDQAMTDAVRTQIAELRAALAEAEKRNVETTQPTTQIDESFEHGEDQVELSFSVQETVWPPNSVSLSLEYTWDDLVDLLGPSMLDEASEQVLRKVLADHAWRELLEIKGGRWAETFPHPKVTILDDSWGRVLVQLRALNIITTGQKKRTVTDKAVYWKLTPAGDEYLVRLKATRRDPDSHASAMPAPQQ